MLQKYFDPNSERFIFKERQYEFKTRSHCLKDISFDQTVGAKKMKFLDKYFDKDDKLEIDMDGMDAA